jgi:hypothetical protein
VLIASVTARLALVRRFFPALKHMSPRPPSATSKGKERIPW